MTKASVLKECRLLRSRAYLGGKWVGSDNVIEVLDPADESLVGSVPDLGGAGAEAAVAAAEGAFHSWRKLTGSQRAAVLRRWAALMLGHQEDLARLMSLEQGKPLTEARNEVAYAAAYLEWFSEEARRVPGDIVTPDRANKRILVIREPVGVVAAVTPWNFPMAMITRKAGPALAVGCTMVLKPSELTPLSALALAALGEEAGLPAGVFNVVTGDAVAIGQVLTDDPRVRKFSFTGSTAVGKLLAARCMATVKRVSLELGGNAPFIVFDDADLDAAVDGAIASKFRNAGQTCVCANRLLVQATVYDAFAGKLAARVATMTVGPSLGGEFDLGPLIDRRAVNKVQSHIADACGRGAKVLTGGRRREGAGYFFEPTVIAGVPADALLCQEETFGPVAGLVAFADEAEGIRLANDTRAGLAAYAYTQGLERSWRVSEALEYGMVGLNTGVISTEVAPFGGVKESGLGREGSRYGLDDYLEMKTISVGIGR